MVMISKELYSQIAGALPFAARQTCARSAFFSLEVVALHVLGLGTLTVDIHVFLVIIHVSREIPVYVFAADSGAVISSRTIVGVFVLTDRW
jgi:hypothetical protein